MTFEQMNLDQNIIQALHTLGYEKPLPYKNKSFPIFFRKRIVL